MRRLFLFACLPLCFGFGGLSLWAASPKWDPVSPAELAEDKPKLEPEAPAEILSYQLEIDDHQQGRRDILRRLRIKIYDPSRTAEITRIARLWNGAANSDYEIAARLTLPDGTSRLFGKNDLREQDVAELGRTNGFFGLVGSQSNWTVEEKFLAITGVVKGAVLDVWESEPKLAQNSMQVYSIQRPLTPIRRFEYISRHSDGPEVIHRVFVLNPCGGRLADDKKTGILNFSAENLPSIHREPFSPPDTYFSLTLIETYEDLWRTLQHRTMSVPIPKSVPASLGPWAYYSTRLDFEDADKGYPTKAVTEKASELVAGATSQPEKARRIYQYVQSLFQRFRVRADLEDWYTRYVESVEELIKLDKIDSTIIKSDDFYFLFIALARSAGLECHTLRSPNRTSFPFNTDMVSSGFLNFRTLAVQVDNSWVIIEPCSEVPLPFGMVPWLIENQPALLAQPQKQLFLNVSSPPAEKSAIETSGELSLDADGNLQGICTRTFTGDFAQVAREKLHATGEEQWPKLARSIFELEQSTGEIRLQAVEGLAAPEEPVRVRAFIRWPAYAAVFGDRMLLSPAVFRDGLPPLLNESNRKTPVFWEFPRSEVDSVRIHLPAGYQPGALPKPISAKSGDFKYSLSLSYAADSGLLVAQRESVNQTVEIPVSGYAKARDWFRRVTVADQIGIVLNRHAPVQPK